jgi:hypothetical protein
VLCCDVSCVGEQLLTTISLQRLRCAGALHDTDASSTNARTRVTVDVARVDVRDELAPVAAHRIALHAGGDDDDVDGGDESVRALRVTLQSLDADDDTDASTHAEMLVRVELVQPRTLLLAVCCMSDRSMFCDLALCA